VTAEVKFKFLSGTASGKMDTEGIGVRLSADLINAKAEAIQVRTGIAFDTGITIDEGVKES